jgi:hypothetical protein
LKELLKKHQTLIIRVYVAIQGQYTLNQNFISFSILNHLYQKNYNGCIRAVTPCLLFFEKLAVTPWGCLDSLFSGVAARKSEKVRKARQTLCAFSAVQRRSQNPDFRRRRRLLRTRVREQRNQTGPMSASRIAPGLRCPSPFKDKAFASQLAAISCVSLHPALPAFHLGAMNPGILPLRITKQAK